MSILGLFLGKSSSRSDSQNAHGNQSSQRSRRSTNYSAVSLMDQVGSIEVSE